MQFPSIVREPFPLDLIQQKFSQSETKSKWFTFSFPEYKNKDDGPTIYRIQGRFLENAESVVAGLLVAELGVQR